MIPQILLLIAVYLFYNLYWKRRNLPPGPTPWPIFGNLLQAALQPPPNAFLAWKKKYGSVFTYWRADMPTIMLTDYASIEHVLLKLPETVVDRVPMHSFNDKYRSGDHGVLFISGPEWRNSRRNTLRILRDLGMGKNVMQQRMLTEIKDVLRIFTKHSASTEPQDICYDINRAVGNIINSILFGYRFEGAKQEEYDELQRRVNEHVKMLAHPLVMIGTYRIETFEKLPFVNSALKRLQKKALTKFFSGQISEHERKLRFDGDAPNTDFVESYLKQMYKQWEKGDYESFSRDILVSICADLWLAGQESTSNTINWGIAYLANNPGIQERAYQEIQSVVGDRIVTMADRPSLPYLNAIVSESQRIGNVIPALVPRRHHKDIKINGFTIKAGTAIVPQVSAVLYDENVFPNPHNFNPDRFLDENGHYKKIDEFIPFVVGKRSCLGEGLARMELFLFMSNLLARFKFLPANGQIDVTRIWGGTATMKPWKCKVIPRF
uniref:Cytochrome P450 n=1 Tax=Bursaphelenchus xylophilus TaxID=6326 RepID=A0A1I7RJ83_BURXY